MTGTTKHLMLTVKLMTQTIAQRILVVEAAAGVHREPAGRALGAGLSPRHPGGRPRPVNDTRAAMLRRCSTQPAGPGLLPRAGVRSLRLCPAPAARPQLPPCTAAGRADVHWFREFVCSPATVRPAVACRRATGLHNRLIGYGTNGPVGRPGLARRTAALLASRRPKADHVAWFAVSGGAAPEIGQLFTWGRVQASQLEAGSRSEAGGTR